MTDIHAFSTDFSIFLATFMEMSASGHHGRGHLPPTCCDSYASDGLVAPNSGTGIRRSSTKLGKTTGCGIRAHNLGEENGIY